MRSAALYPSFRPISVAAADDTIASHFAAGRRGSFRSNTEGTPCQYAWKPVGTPLEHRSAAVFQRCSDTVPALLLASSLPERRDLAAAPANDGRIARLWFCPVNENRLRIQIAGDVRFGGEGAGYNVLRVQCRATEGSGDRLPVRSLLIPIRWPTAWWSRTTHALTARRERSRARCKARSARQALETPVGKAESACAG